MNATKTSFLDRLAAADRIWQREKGRAFWWSATPWLLGVALLAFSADAFLQLGRTARLVWLGASFTLAFAALAAGSYLGWIRRNCAERTARFLEERNPSLGSQLINRLQLVGKKDDPHLSALTRSIAAQAISRYDAELTETDFLRLAATGESRRWLKRAAWALGLFAVLLAVFYPVTSLVLPRFLDPFGDHPPYAFTRVEIVDPGEAGAEVVYGGKFSVKARWSGHQPRDLFVTVHPAGKPGEVVTLPMIRDGDQGFSQEIANVRDDLVVVAHSKNHSFYSRQRSIRVLLTPKIEKAYLEITPPAYTGLKPEERPFSFKSAAALEGSQLRFRLQSNRPLREGNMEIVREGKTDRLGLQRSDEKEVSGAFDLKDSARVRFRVTDIDGIASDDQPEAFVTVTHDLPPVVKVAAPAQDGFVSADFKLTAKFEATDDYGLKMLRIHTALNARFNKPDITEIDRLQRDFSRGLPMDFAALGAKPGDRVSFFAEAIDTAPTPHLSRSQTITLTVISEEDYNNFIRERNDVRDLSGKYEDLMRQFQQLRNEQVELAKEAALLREKAKTEKDAAGLVQQFDAMTARQNELNQRLNQQADRMEHFVRANPIYDFERDLQNRLTEEAKLIRASTGLNGEALNQVAQESSRPDGSRALTAAALEKLRDEAKAQAERLGARDREMADSIRKPLEDLSQFHDLVNDFNLFEQLYQSQQQLAQQSRAYSKKGPLSREDQLALKDLAAQQEAIREALDQLPASLRAHAEAAQTKFPKAAASGQKLAQAIESERFASLANSATDKMLAADGEQSAQLAQRLEAGMAKLFGECCNRGEAGDELDQYLKLTWSGGKKQSLAQMQQCRKFGLGNGMFPGMGKGSGSGYSMNSNANPAILGNEPISPNGAKQSAKTSANGSQSGGLADGAFPALQLQPPDVMKGLHPADRRSDAVQSEGNIEEYRTLVEQYFNTITHEKNQ